MIPLKETKVRFVRTIEDLTEAARWLEEPRRVLAIDTETAGLEWWHQPLRLVQFGDTDTSWVFVWRWWAGAVKELLARAVELRLPLIFHNAKFDLHFLQQAGAFKTPPWPLVHDTMVMCSLVDGGRPAALKLAATRHVDQGAAVGQRLLDEAMAKSNWTWATVPEDFAPYWGYAGLDTILTARLALALKPKVDAEFASLYELEREVAVVLYEMERRGARIDRAYTGAKLIELDKQATTLSGEVKAEHGIAVGSPQQLRDRLLALGAVIERKTDKGQPSTDGVTLKLLSLDPNPLIAELASKALVARKSRKTVSAYLKNFLAMADADDRVHPSIKQQGARTGRMSVATPSLQNLTRGPTVRDCFIPSEGNTLVTADYDQIEMRLLYHYCRDPGLYQAIMSGDLHTTTAQLVYGDPSITKDDPRRQPAKSAGFSKIYGAGLDQFAATAGVTVDEARHFLALYAEAFPGVDPFMGKVQSIGRQRLRDTGEAWVKTDGGRRQVANPDKLYTLTNYLIQGTAADVLKEQTVRLAKAGLDQYMILPVHDELVFDVPTDVMPDLIAEVRRTMPVPEERFGVPLTVGIDVLDRWGQKYREHATVDDLLEFDEETGEVS